MGYLYGVDLEQGEQGEWYASFPQFPGAFADGDTMQEAIGNAADVLRMFIAEYLDEGKPLPDSGIRDDTKAVISVDVSDSFRASSKCMTVSEAADALGVTPGRVSQLLTAGQLEPYMDGGTRLVTIESVNARLSSKPRTGRPRKEAAIA